MCICDKKVHRFDCVININFQTPRGVFFLLPFFYFSAVSTQKDTQCPGHILCSSPIAFRPYTVLEPRVLIGSDLCLILHIMRERGKGREERCWAKAPTKMSLHMFKVPHLQWIGYSHRQFVCLLLSNTLCSNCRAVMVGWWLLNLISRTPGLSGKIR